jgi:hypothetical protein
VNLSTPVKRGQTEVGASSRLAHDGIIVGVVSFETKQCAKTHDEVRVEEK